MIKRGLLIVAIVAVLCAGSVVVAQPDRSPVPDGRAVLSGGNYRLSQSVNWPAVGALTGGGYRLSGLAPEADPAAGCCCKAMLPCVRR